MKNRLKAVLRGRGILADAGVYEEKSRGKWLKELPAAGHRAAAEWLGRELDELVPLREEAEDWLLKEAKAHPIIKTLSTAPGMGPLRTAQMVAIVITPHRFRTPTTVLELLRAGDRDAVVVGLGARTRTGSGRERWFGRPEG